jgi:hypothetical protein
MNNATLKVRIEAINPTHSQDGSLQVTANSMFKFFDKGEIKIRPLIIQAFGHSAVTINQAGIGSICLISGRLSIYKPTEHNPSHQMLFWVEKVILIKSGSSVQNVVQFPQNPPFTNPYPPVTINNPVMAYQGNGKVAQFEEIPF